MNTSNNLPEIIGIGGTFASGKDTLAEYLVRNYGYNHVSTGDIVRIAARERYGNIERPTLQITGGELREEGGSGVLAEKALQRPRPLVITGIRTSGEAETIKAAGGVMLFIDADPEKRYERMQIRQRDNEVQQTLDEFLAKEKKEIEGTVANADQNIGVVRSLSDIMLDNSGELNKFLNDTVKTLQQHQPRPTASR